MIGRTEALSSRRRPLAHRALASLLAAGCSAVYDFDDLEGLPCPCDAEHVCDEASGRCVPVSSVEPFKSCPQETPLEGDELCPVRHRCVAVLGQGPRCLPQCEPVLYARPDAGREVAAQCPFGTTCWPSEKGGVCAEGVCRDNPNSCEPGRTCVLFNGAGVCFTDCQIFQPSACGGNQICHPIGLASVTACIDAGGLPEGSVCTRPGDGMCRRTDDQNRALLCARPEAATRADLFCRPVCNFADGVPCLPGETCVLVRANVDPFTGTDIGVCE